MSEKVTQISDGLKITWIGIGANVFLVVLKIYAGLLSRSQALLADGIHSLSDLLSDVIVLFGLKWGSKDADSNHPFGHGRFETLSSMSIGLILILIGAGFVYEAVSSLYAHDVVNPTPFTLIVAIISILIKEMMYWYTLRIGKRLKSMVLIGNAWHHRTDALSSVAVLIGVGGAYLNPDWHLADALASLFVTYFVIRVGGKLIWSALKEVVDTAPDSETIDSIIKTAESVEGVLDAHDVKARFSGGQIYTEIHIVVNSRLTVYEGHAIAKKVEFLLIDSIEDLVNVIVHVDPSQNHPSDLKKDS